MLNFEGKIDVTKADIVVRGTIEKPYYCIIYKEVEGKESNEGFGSYYLENVFQWKDRYLNVVEEKSKAKVGERFNASINWLLFIIENVLLWHPNLCKFGMHMLKKSIKGEFNTLLDEEK